MKLGTVKTISREDIGSEAPGWVDKLLSPLNQFLEQSYRALSNNLTFTDNFRGKVAAYKLKHATALEINHALTSRVVGVLPLAASGQMITGFKWDYSSAGEKVTVMAEFKAAGSTEAEVRLLFVTG